MSRAQGQIEIAIRQHVATHPDTTWLKWRDEEVAWSEVLANANRAANGLLALGIQPGDRVALMMSNRPEFVWAHLGILFIGASSVPVNISQRGPALEHILADCGARAVIFQPDLLGVVSRVTDALPHPVSLVMVGDSATSEGHMTFEALMDNSSGEPTVSLSEPTGGVGMMYTSGTTGPPKGVVATGYDITPMLEMLRSAGVKPGDTLYTGLPLFHGNALLVSMLGSIMLDAKLALAPKFTASGLWDDCRRFGAVEFNALGGMISILLKQPPRSDDRDHPVRTVISAGCPPDRWEEFEERFGVRLVEWFGMVDSPGLLLNLDGKVGSMGRSGVRGVEFQVVDQNDETVSAGTVGELVFRHPKGPLTHYHGMPEATAQAYRNGWFHSGDLAEMDEDGNFYYRGRAKESMRRLGENISAWELETVINGHPAVLESGAHAVPSPLGEDEVKVCVVLRPRAELTPQQLLEHCEGKLAKYAMPRYIEWVESLPKTATERIQYAALRARGITPNTWDVTSQTYLAEQMGDAQVVGQATS